MNKSKAMEMVEKMKDGALHRANAKADEIREQAKQDAELLRQRIVYNEKAKISEEMAKEKEKILSNKSVRLSEIVSKKKKELLQIRDEAIKEAMKMAEVRLSEIAQTDDYYEVLRNLCLEGLSYLMEPKVELAVRECDGPFIQQSLESMSSYFEEKAGLKVELTLSDYVVPNEAIGGVVLIARNGTIQMSNTFKDRIGLVCSDLYPQIRKILVKE